MTWLGRRCPGQSGAVGVVSTQAARGGRPESAVTSDSYVDLTDLHRRQTHLSPHRAAPRCLGRAVPRTGYSRRS